MGGGARDLRGRMGVGDSGGTIVVVVVVGGNGVGGRKEDGGPLNSEVLW